jgi:hypothetical protein
MQQTFNHPRQHPKLTKAAQKKETKLQEKLRIIGLKYAAILKGHRELE